MGIGSTVELSFVTLAHCFSSLAHPCHHATEYEKGWGSNNIITLHANYSNKYWTT